MTIRVGDIVRGSIGECRYEVLYIDRCEEGCRGTKGPRRPHLHIGGRPIDLPRLGSAEWGWIDPDTLRCVLNPTFCLEVVGAASGAQGALAI